MSPAHDLRRSTEHKPPRPNRPINPLGDPLVGNLSADENRREHAAGVLSVIDHIESTPGHEQNHDAIKPAPTHMVVLRRFCAADEASTSAAIREAVGRLDALFPEVGELPPNLVIVYTNALPGTVTLDIGMPSLVPPQLPANSEFHIAPMPLPTGIQAEAAAGFAGLASACAELSPQAAGTSHPHPIFWQTFASSDFRPWIGHPKATVHLST